MTIFSRHRLRFYRRTCLPVIVLSGEIDFRLTGADDFPWDRHPMTAHYPAYRERFAAGGEAMIGSSGDEIVFTAWMQHRSLRIDELAWTWRLQDPDAVVYDVVTFESWRGRGIYPEALRRLTGLLAEEGVRHLWIYAEADNRASLNGIEKAGFEYRGTMHAWTLAGLTLRRGRVEGVNA